MLELQHLKSKYAVKEIEIVDDSFNLNVKRAKDLFQAVIDSSLDLYFSFPNGLRADVMDEELVGLMKKAGIYRLVYAIESGSPRVQKAMKKNLNLEKARRIIAYTARKGISVILYAPTASFKPLRVENTSSERFWSRSTCSSLRLRKRKKPLLAKPLLKGRTTVACYSD